MNNKKFALCFLIFSIAFSSSVFALPCAFFGTVKLDGNPINGTHVTAHLNDTGAYLTTAEEVAGFGNYTIAVDAADKIIRFKIAGTWVNEPEQNCVSGNTSYLDLTLNTLPDNSVCEQDIVCNSTYCVHDVCRPTDPYAGDGFCDTGENCKNSPTDCPCPSGQSCGDDGTCYTPKPPSGPIISGGGGGGIYITPCTEKWNCADWSDCIAGTQTRTCKDDNNCGTTKNKSAESQTCSIITGGATGETSGGTTTLECSEDWTCTDWSDCIGGTRTKTCVDKNNCGTTINKPTEAETCSVSPTTGLFLSMNTPVGYGIAALILAAIVAIIYFFFKKRKGHKK